MTAWRRRDVGDGEVGHGLSIVDARLVIDQSFNFGTDRQYMDEAWAVDRYSFIYQVVYKRTRYN